MFAGMVAVAAQKAGHRARRDQPGPVRHRARAAAGIVDVTDGDNSFGDVDGFEAVTGYDLASGLGSVDAAHLVPELAAAMASAQLTALISASFDAPTWVSSHPVSGASARHALAISVFARLVDSQAGHPKSRCPVSVLYRSRSPRG